MYIQYKYLNRSGLSEVDLTSSDVSVTVAALGELSDEVVLLRFLLEPALVDSVEG